MKWFKRVVKNTFEGDSSCKIGLAQFKVSGITSDRQCSFEQCKVGYIFSFLLEGYGAWPSLISGKNKIAQKILQ